MMYYIRYDKCKDDINRILKVIPWYNDKELPTLLQWGHKYQDEDNQIIIMFNVNHQVIPDHKLRWYYDHCIERDDIECDGIDDMLMYYESYKMGIL